MTNQILILIFSYTVSSLWENFVHWKILHSNKPSRRMWRKFGWIGQLMRCAYFSHNIIHHKNTFKESYFIQFSKNGECDRLKHKLPKLLRNDIIRNRYGLTISSFWEVFTFSSFPLLVNLFLFVKSSEFITILFIFIISIAPLLLSKYLHPSLHDECTLETYKYNAWARYKKYIAQCHKVHHENGMKNFNLLPGGDFIVGTYEKYKD